MGVQERDLIGDQLIPHRADIHVEMADRVVSDLAQGEPVLLPRQRRSGRLEIVVGHAHQEWHVQSFRRSCLVPWQAKHEPRGEGVAPARGFPTQLRKDLGNLWIGKHRRIPRSADDAGQVRRPPAAGRAARRAPQPPGASEHCA